VAQVNLIDRLCLGACTAGALAHVSAPRRRLQGPQAGTRLSMSSLPPAMTGIRWSAVEAGATLHQWQRGLLANRRSRLRRYLASERWSVGTSGWQREQGDRSAGRPQRPQVSRRGIAQSPDKAGRDVWTHLTFTMSLACEFRGVHTSRCVEGMLRMSTRNEHQSSIAHACR
jgi:hypothetical protein